MTALALCLAQSERVRPLVYSDHSCQCLYRMPVLSLFSDAIIRKRATSLSSKNKKACCSHAVVRAD